MVVFPAPLGGAGLHIDGVDAARQGGAFRHAAAAGHVIFVARQAGDVVGIDLDVAAQIAQRHIHDIGLGAIGSHRPIAPPAHGWADAIGLVQVEIEHVLVDGH